MQAMSLAHAKAHLSELLNTVESGVEVVMSIVPVLVRVWLLSAFGCNNVTLGASDPTAGDGVADAVDPGDDDDASSPEPERPLAGGLSISKVSMYQGVEAVLYEDGKKPSTLEMPAIVGREALVRNKRASGRPKDRAVLILIGRG